MPASRLFSIRFGNSAPPPELLRSAFEQEIEHRYLRLGASGFATFELRRRIRLEPRNASAAARRQSKIDITYVERFADRFDIGFVVKNFVRSENRILDMIDDPVRIRYAVAVVERIRVLQPIRPSENPSQLGSN